MQSVVEPPQAKIPPTVILGMHRANTSMIAQIAASLGLSLGPDSSFASASTDNEEGYTEDLRFHRISEEILHRFGGTWNCIPNFPSEWWKDSRLDDLALDLRGLIAANDDLAPWAWKDPRVCITLPFFLQQIPNLRLVVCLRHPVEVAFSLAFRRSDTTDYDTGLALWHQHYAALLPLLGSQETIVIDGNVMRENPMEEVARLAAFLKLSVGNAKLEEAANSIRSDLKRSTPVDMDRMSEELSPEIKEMYSRLSALAGLSSEAISSPSPREQYPNVEDAIGRIRKLEKLIIDKSGDVASARHYAVSLEAEAGKRSSAVRDLWKDRDELYARLADLDSQNRHLAEQLALRDARLNQLADQVAGLTEDVMQKTETLDSAKSQIEILQNQNSALREEVHAYANLRLIRTQRLLQKIWKRT